MDEVAVSNWRKLLLEEKAHAVSATTGEVIALSASGAPSEEQPKRLIFPGAFNPFHNGHREMADIAGEMTGLEIEFEISIHNVDKPAVRTSDLVKRLRQFPPNQPIWLTQAMRFFDKATLFPNATFVVGADTLLRIADRKYYKDAAHLESSIAHVAAQGGNFLVFARRFEGVIYELDSMELMPKLRELCVGVPQSRFLQDVSSTEIRIAKNENR